MSTILRKQLREATTKGVELPGDVCRFVITTDDIDRDGDIVEPKGLRFDDYLANPVFLWGHQFGMPPIGKCIGIKLSPDGRELRADIQFAVKESEFAAQVCRLYKGGYLNAVSVGFRILRSGPPDRFIPSRPDLGQQCKRVITSAVLLEISAVSIPSNAAALQKAIAAGLVVSKSLRSQITAATPPVGTLRLATADDIAREVAADLRPSLPAISKAIAEGIVDGVSRGVAAMTNAPRA